jgi:uncharacterized membrane protein
MLKLLNNNKQKYNEALFMGSLTLFCFAFSVFRVFYTKSIFYLFLNWNLFLAFVPWALSTYATIKPQLQKNKLAISLVMLTWLLFFPNAPYILTDLIHLRSSYSMPVWFDLILILCFAWTGLLFGFLSFWDIERILKLSIKNRWVNLLSIALLFLGGFGTYMGRYLRWNTWDIVSEPVGIIKDVGIRVLNPFEYPNTWGMTLFMGFFLNMLYWSFRLIRQRIE